MRKQCDDDRRLCIARQQAYLSYQRIQRKSHIAAKELNYCPVLKSEKACVICKILDGSSQV
jgi:hypothetical protein